MSIDKDATEIKKLVEAIPVFKAASPEQIAARPKDTGWDYESLKAKLPDDVQYMQDLGFMVEIDPGDGHRLGFFIGEDIFMVEDLPHLFRGIMESARKLSDMVRGPKI
jgi:hypothetical protein